MCGIAGIYDPHGPSAPRSLLLQMAGELAHRGPDGVGLYLDQRFGMVNTRLSIVDLAGGDQPLSDESGLPHQQVQAHTPWWFLLRETHLKGKERWPAQ